MGELLPSSLLLDIPSLFHPSFRYSHQLASIQTYLEGLSSVQFRIALCYLVFIRPIHSYLLHAWGHSTVVFEWGVDMVRLKRIADNLSLQCVSRRRVRSRFRKYMDFMRDSFPNKHSTFVIFSRGYLHLIDITKCSIVQALQCLTLINRTPMQVKVTSILVFRNQRSLWRVQIVRTCS